MNIVKKIELFWNTIYYILWKWNLWSFLFVQNMLNNYLTPLVPLRFRTNAMRNPQLVKDYYSQKDGGPCHWFAANNLNGLAACYSLFFVGILDGILMRFHQELLGDVFGIFILLFAWFLSDRLVLHNKKYLNYFPMFEKKSPNWRRKWTIITFIVVLGGLSMLFFSILLLDLFYH